MRGIKTKESCKWKKVTAVLVLFMILMILVNSVRKVHNKKVEAEKALARMENGIGELQNRQKDLSSSLEKLETEDGMEFEMRKKLNVAEVGESVAIIVEETTTTSPSIVPISSWQKFKDFVVDLFR